jgi:UDP-GlcNAc:undecaprenyl-phosphate GlcNAc-1-phosphate transferase
VAHWVIAFVVAGIVTLIATPLMRRLALATGFVDQPAARKSHTRPTPYLGGLAIIAGTVLGLRAAGVVGERMLAAVIAATALAAVGLVDDRRTVHPLPRLLAQLVAAGAVVSLGIRVHVTGVATLDVVITLIWIVGFTNALNLLDNMDCLAGGVALTTSLGALALAALGDQTAISVMAAGLAGACIGYLPYNARPATIFMGDTGSLFLGFVLSVVVLEVDPASSPPASFLVPLMLLALPMLDTTTVTVARLRNGRSVASGGKDHLSHRLVVRGLSPGWAVAALVAAQGLMAALAVLAGREVVHIGIAVFLASLVLAAVAAATLPARVYDTHLTPPTAVEPLGSSMTSSSDQPQPEPSWSLASPLPPEKFG